MTTEPSNGEILEAMQEFASHVDSQFRHVDEQFRRIHSEMVTKDYLDRKIFEVRGDLVALVRKEDQKVDGLIDELVDRGGISRSAGSRVKWLSPFPRQR